MASEKMGLHALKMIDKEYWQPDDAVNACPTCNAVFTILKGRHHCRQCGDVYCGACTPKRKVPSASVTVRLCNACYGSIKLIKSPPPLVPREGEETPTNLDLSKAEAKVKAKAKEADKEKGMSAVDRVIPIWAYLLYPYILDKDFGFGTLNIEVCNGRNLMAADTNLLTANTSDPYCTIKVFLRHNPLIEA